MMMGRPLPSLPKSGKAWSSVTMPAITSATWLSMVLSSPESPQVLATMMPGVMMPTTAATTCWSARGMSSWGVGVPSCWNRTDVPWLSLMCLSSRHTGRTARPDFWMTILQTVCLLSKLFFFFSHGRHGR